MRQFSDPEERFIIADMKMESKTVMLRSELFVDAIHAFA